LNVYAATTFFVSLYIKDLHSQEVKLRMSTHRKLWLSPLHRAEWEHAVAQHIFRGVMTRSEADEIRSAVNRDCDVGLWLLADLPAGIFTAAVHLARSYVPTIGVRTLDTLHVASALELGAEAFWTFDQRQAKLAKAAGLHLS
jgi:predicted nucleic acid-binding protein